MALKHTHFGTKKKMLQSWHSFSMLRFTQQLLETPLCSRKEYSKVLNKEQQQFIRFSSPERDRRYKTTEARSQAGAGTNQEFLAYAGANPVDVFHG